MEEKINYLKKCKETEKMILRSLSTSDACDKPLKELVFEWLDVKENISLLDRWIAELEWTKSLIGAKA